MSHVIRKSDFVRSDSNRGLEGEVINETVLSSGRQDVTFYLKNNSAIVVVIKGGSIPNERVFINDVSITNKLKTQTGENIFQEVADIMDLLKDYTLDIKEGKAGRTIHLTMSDL